MWPGFGRLIAFARGDKHGNCSAAKAVDAAYRLEQEEGFQVLLQEVTATRTISIRTATIRTLILNKHDLISQSCWKASRKWLYLF